ncbi:MAG: hypothetical protein KA981_04470 [Bacteroidia bacterium]|jgi:hypothetical protein|nr:hypothetical protein [Bacteroidia bacterium]
MKKIKFTLFTLLLGFQIFAQAPSVPPLQNAGSFTKIDTSNLNLGPAGTSLGLMVSTNGVGLQFAQNLGKNKLLALRLGGMYLPFKLSNFENDFDGTTLVINGDLKLGALQALIDFHPFKNAFKITGGVAYMLTDVTAIGNVKDSVLQADILLSPDEVGKIDIGIKVGPICPYVGLGFGRAIPRSRASFNFEIGGYYISQPKVSFVASGMLEPSSANETIIQDNMKGYSWLPVMNFGINFKISK